MRLSYLLFHQFRREKLLSQQLRGERDEQDLRHKRALEEEEEVTRARKRQKQSIIEDLVRRLPKL